MKLARPFSLLASAVVACLFTSCGGDSGDGAGGDEPLPPGALVGSYDLHVPRFDMWSFDDARARVDVRYQQGAYEAVVAPAGGVAASYSVHFDGASVSLRDGRATLGNHAWLTLSLPIDEAGSLRGAAKVGGEYVEHPRSDFSVRGSFEAPGEIGADETAPALTPSPSPVVDPADRAVDPLRLWLPWTPWRVRASEGVDGAALVAATSLVDGSGNALDAVWGRPGAGASDLGWTGTYETSPLLLADWDAFAPDVAAGASAPVVARVAAGVSDLRGLRSPAAEVGASFVRLGGPRAAYAFDPEGDDPYLWGDARVFGRDAPDARCESGGCLQLGDADAPTGAFSGASEAGAAGRLVGPGGAVRVRYRIFGKWTRELSDSGPPRSHPLLFAVSVASPGREPIVGFAPPLELRAGDEAALAATGMSTASEWADLVVEAPAGAEAAELGVALATGRVCGGPCPPEAFVVVVDAIDVR